MKSYKSLYFVLVVSLLLFWSRVIPHEANLTPVLALCLLAGMWGQGKWYGFVLPILALFASDMTLGFYPGWAMTYIPLILLIGMGFFMKNRLISLAGFGFLGALAFFALSNLGVWYYTGLYSKDFHGLLNCYTAGLPFFRTTLVSTLGCLMAFYAFSMVFKSEVVQNQLNRVS